MWNMAQTLGEISTQMLQHCSVVKCTNPAEVGAHVIKQGSKDLTQYIVPLCQEHNKSTDVLDIGNETDLVFANKNFTCENLSVVKL